MRTVGVDLAAEPKKTALAVIDWTDGVARVESVRLGVGNDVVVEAVLASGRTGIDAPFGWPDAFVRMVSEHHAGRLPATNDLANRDGRRPLTKRRTDLVVQAATGISPLSVSADLIAHVALRCAGLLAELGERGVDVGRVDGRVVEVYPAAALRIWGLVSRGYKSAQNRVTLGELVDALLAAADWLDLGAFQTICRESDDALDAVLAAVIARAAAVGCTALPDGDDRETGEREGWIHLPEGALESLRP
ncbi:DUF429 domain-containing protein [Rhodococcus opacus]|nr:DUF429 domain-containing protein [Rhodococcus opacus]RZL83611.1 MAG: DUF429 domain-containing protein [Rhodococcus sp. (in: high G+C Gram-positive bacteria)]